ncbi:hypothetical protein KR054_008884 [Drosophila jambulina]|nr:hypothetical protein KR054_008884 [Drosophila jambulina]
MMNSLVNLYFNYSLFIGITSHRFVNQKFRTSIFSRFYALVANILTITLLPLVMWYTRIAFQAKGNFPQLIVITYNVRYLVTYSAIIYTILSRGFRDTAFREMEPLLLKLNEEEKRCGRQDVRRSLMILLYVKFFTVIWLCLTDTFFLFYTIESFKLLMIARFIFLSNGNNVLLMVPMGYFLALWHIARGLDCVNRRLEAVITSKPRTPRDLEELHHLWSLHTALTKAAVNINKIYAPQMLASRCDNFIIGVIQAYWGAFFAFGTYTPVFWLVYGCVSYYMRSLDYYLIDHMCEVVVEYQSSARHAWSEQRWSKEISAFAIYSNSLKLELWTCGLYQPNRSLWFGMLTSVWYYICMLLQFHLVLGNFKKIVVN